MLRVENLLEEDEVLGEYVIEGNYYESHCIINKDSDDIGAALEDTLHRILEAGGTQEDVYQIMGAAPCNDWDENETPIDLGYVIPGEILSFRKLNEYKTLQVTCTCTCVYNSSIQVPSDMSLEEAIEYAKEHINEIPIGELNYVSDSDELDEENCNF